MLLKIFEARALPRAAARKNFGDRSKNVKNHNLKARMEYSSKSSMTEVDRRKKTCFEICGILKESKTNSKK